MKIKSKLIIAFLSISLSSLVLISTVFYYKEKKNLTREILNHLESVASIQKNRIEDMIQQNHERLKLVMSITQLRIDLKNYIDSRNYTYQHKINRIINNVKYSVIDFENISIASVNGQIIASTDAKMIGQNYSKDISYIHGQKDYCTDIFSLDNDNTISIILSGPLILNNELLGVILIESSTENIFSSLRDYTGLGNTGETILAKRNINKDVVFLMPTRFNRNAALRLTIPKERTGLTITKSFKSNGNVFTDSLDYRNAPVLAVTRYIRKTDWGIVVKMDKDEAFNSIIQMRNLMIITFVICAMLLIITSLYFSKSITSPITRLTDVVRKISQGNSVVRADETSNTETGILAKAFNQMTDNLIRSKKIIENKMQEVRDSDERIRLLLNSTAESIYGLDKDGNCTFCNPSCLRALGYQKDSELLGKNIHKLIHHTKTDGSEYPVDKCKILHTVKNGEKTNSDIEFFWKADKTSFPVEYWSYPIIKNNEIVGAVVTFVDISKRKEAEEEKEKLNIQLMQAQKMEAIGTLAGGIAHDFNNILSAILGYSELAIMKISRENEIHQDIEQIIKAGTRAKDLVRQILTFSHKSEIKQIRIELSEILKEVLELLKASIPKTIDIRESIEIEDGTILGDPTQIHQVLMNLCTNAYHAMREKGGILSVELSQIDTDRKDIKTLDPRINPDCYLQIQVSDTGHGMEKAVMERIFEPYFTTKIKSGGTGMGLAVVHSIIKTHHGHIYVYSEPGKGSTFKILLPKLVNSEVDSEISNEDNLPGGNEHILLVDDEESIKNFQKLMLEHLGYNVTATTNSEELLSIFKSDPKKFNLIITDMTMPNMTGIELAKNILGINPEIPIILCTGFSDMIDEEKAKSIGIREYITKPAGIKDLARAVRKALDESCRKNTT